MTEKAREQKVFCRAYTPTERRVIAAFLYHAGLSYRRIEPFVERSYEAIQQWFHRLQHLFDPDCRDRHEVAVDETKIEVDGEEVYVWAAVDCETLEVLHVDVSPGRSSLDALLFLKEVLKACRGRPLVRADRGPWYDWPLELLECEYEREMWGNRSLIEAWFGLFKYRTRRFWHRFPHNSSMHSTRYGLRFRLLNFGGQARSQQPIYEVTRPEIERLADQTSEVANLVIEEHGCGVYLICEHGDQAVDLDIYPSVRQPVHLTASGKAILAHLDGERVDAIVDRHGLPAQTSESITSRDELLNRLDTVRSRGFAVDDEKHISGLRCTGAPIVEGKRKVLGAVGVSVPVTRMSDQKFFNEIPDSVRSATNVIELQLQNA